MFLVHTEISDGLTKSAPVFTILLIVQSESKERPFL